MGVPSDHLKHTASRMVGSTDILLTSVDIPIHESTHHDSLYRDESRKEKISPHSTKPQDDQVSFLPVTLK
jgi:hypothetical protein